MNIEIKKITYLQKNTFNGKYSYELDVEACTESILDGAKYFEFEHQDSKLYEKAMKIYNVIKNWEDKYINTKVIDGMEYTCIIEFSDGTLKKTYGKNKFPEGFFELKSLMGNDFKE